MMTLSIANCMIQYIQYKMIEMMTNSRRKKPPIKHHQHHIEMRMGCPVGMIYYPFTNYLINVKARDCESSINLLEEDIFEGCLKELLIK